MGVRRLRGTVDAHIPWAYAEHCEKGARHRAMLRRLYVHNYRCFENFELRPDEHSTLLIGRNGSGKSTLTHALALLQRIARGTNRVAQLVEPGDFARGRSDVPMRFELDAELSGHTFQYAVALELPKGARELRVLTEVLRCDDAPIFTRDRATVAPGARDGHGRFDVDWHLLALPIVQERDATDPLAIFKRWLARMIVLAPLPSQIDGTSSAPTLEPDRTARNLGDWFTALLAMEPGAYGPLASYLREVFPDFQAVQNPSTGGDTRRLQVQFQSNGATLTLPFAALSDGEKCFFLAALTIAAGEVYGPLLCVWDEADAHLGLSEVCRFTLGLRRAARRQLQLVVTSHNPEAIRAFGDETTRLLTRASHLEPTRVLRLADVPERGDDVIAALTRGDLDP